ncbi:MAG: MATE family efflux transporter, partial [Pseudomonadota bacterium]
MAEKTSKDAPQGAVTHRCVLAIAVPMTLAYLSTPLLGLVDTTVIGRLGQAELLGAIAIGAILFDIVFTSFNFLRAGTTGITAQALGARDDTELRATLGRAVAIALVAGLLLILLQRPVLSLGIWAMNASAEVNANVETYFQIRVLAAPLTLVNYAVLGWFIGLGRATTGLLLQTFLNGLNIVLNIWFVLGLGWGVAGVAWGTVIGEVLTAILGAFVALRLL